MKNVIAAIATICLIAGFAVTAAAESQTQSDDAELGAEYQRLLQMVKAQKKPVQSIDGDLDIAGRPGIGPKDAEVILVEFGDFQCPFCRRHLQGAAQQIREKLVSTGRVRYVFLDFPVEAKHPLAARAATAARCAEEQGRYWEMRNILYTNQKALHELFLVEHAKGAGLDVETFSGCLDSGRYDAAIRQDKLVGQSLGVQGTPTFFLGINQGDRITLVRKIRGVQPYEVFEREILRAGEIAQQPQRGMQGAEGGQMGS